ncbi:uncharacterized protein K452DRAFT_313020 [Aplosporella prunicola CBS 121167]|uniref:Uncharacterized protein n=1 Tax=Aplosporella prunicola CBS 121167 TaxID=1176127 RepID=A0A6A6AXG9_9PEZI|nr:uncharacterized protein K452DRAFT_313020 [Aplosporella prunicola CBS 121167]KAF2136652.1 hypothetical protein K452DRAFT_313020 [Aplosporella prunicola CBS 121167]
MAAHYPLVRPPPPVLPIPLPDHWVSDRKRFGHSEVKLAPETGVPLNGDTIDYELADDAAINRYAKVYFFIEHQITKPIVRICTNNKFKDDSRVFKELVAKLTTLGSRLQNGIIGIPGKPAEDFSDSWFLNWHLKDTFTAAKKAYLSELRTARAKKWTVDNYNGNKSIGKERLGVVVKNWKKKMDELIQKVEDFNPIPTTDDFAIYELIPANGLYYKDLNTTRAMNY